MVEEYFQIFPPRLPEKVGLSHMCLAPPSMHGESWRTYVHTGIFYRGRETRPIIPSSNNLTIEVPGGRSRRLFKEHA
jgi:hypothetical protein